MIRSRASFVYLAIDGATALFFGMVYTIMAVYRVQVIGLDPQQLVLVGTALETSVFAFQVPTGIIADVFSRRLAIALGYVFIGAAIILEGLIPLFLFSILSQVVSGLGYSLTIGATEAWLAGEIGAENIGSVFLRGSQIGQITSIVGILLGAALASARLNLPIVLGGALMSGLGVVLLFIMPETGFKPQANAAVEPKRSVWRSAVAILREALKEIRVKPILITIIGITFIFGAFSEALDRLWEAHFLKDFTFPVLGALQPVFWFAVIRIGVQILGLAANEVARRRVDTTNRRSTARALMIINLIIIVGIILFGLVTNFWLAVVAYWSVALSRTTRGPLYSAWLTQNIDDNVRATVISMDSQSDALGQVIGGPLIGTIGKLFSLPVVMVVAGIILSPGILLYRRALRQDAKIGSVEEATRAEA